MSNLSWGMQFRTCGKIWESADLGLALSQIFPQIQKPYRHYFDCDCANANQLRISTNLKNNSSLRDSVQSAESWQSTIKISRTKCNRISPVSWCKKSDSRLQKCNRRFFARSGESEALPLKAKSGSFWEIHLKIVGGSEDRGVQPFCEKESSENDGEIGAESSADSAFSQNPQKKK